MDSISDRIHSSLTLEAEKPDSKVALSGPGSPVSPLLARPAVSGSSSSSGSVGKSTNLSSNNRRSESNTDRRSHSGELSGDTSSTARPRPTHRRTGSSPLVFTGSSSINTSSTASSPVTNLLPAGNICPSGKIGKGGPAPRAAPRPDVLGTGMGNYGHGSIMRGGSVGSFSSGKSIYEPSRSNDVEEVTRLGNEYYKKGFFGEAMKYYDRAVELCPGNAACRSNRAAALVGLGRLDEAVKACEEAIRLDPGYGRAHHRLGALHLRLGQIENAKKHFHLTGQFDHNELQKLQIVERHLGKCFESRKVSDWISALREADAAIAAGADSSPLIIACRAESLLRLHRLEEADKTLSSRPRIESCSQFNLLGMTGDSYTYIVQAQIDMAFGRFENAIASAEQAKQLDSRNMEVITVYNNVRSVARARAQGSIFFKSGNYAEASTAYGEGLRYDSSNPVLLCNRAVCRAKLGQWERSIEDCNEALKVQPKYVKSLLRRATSYVKLERWAEAVRDYEVLRKMLPDDKEVAEALFHANIALKTSRGEEVSNMKFGGEVEDVTGLDQFQAEISLSGVSVVYFMTKSNQHCSQISPFVDALCNRYPSLNFLKVDISKSPTVAMAENVRTVPTFKIYKNGAKMKEMICPSQQVLEYSVRHYGL